MARMVSSGRPPDRLIFLISAPSRAARLTMSARGMTLSMDVVLLMIVFSPPRSPGQSSAIRRSRVRRRRTHSGLQALLGRNVLRRPPDRRRIEFGGKILRDRSVDTGLVCAEIGQEQIAADPRHDCRDIASEARHVANRQAKADKGRGVEGVN